MKKESVANNSIDEVKAWLDSVIEFVVISSIGLPVKFLQKHISTTFIVSATCILHCNRTAERCTTCWQRR